jgi:hypothetical protein
MKWSQKSQFSTSSPLKIDLKVWMIKGFWKLKNWKMGEMEECRFLRRELGFDENNSYFRDFHQILGRAVVFTARWKNGKNGKD